MGINVNGAQNSNLPLPEQTKKKEEGQKAENSIFTKYDNNKDGTISASADNTAARYVKTQGKTMFSAQCAHAAQVGGSFNDIASTLLKSITFSFSPATLNPGESKSQVKQQLNASCESEMQAKIQGFITNAAEAYTNAINNNYNNNGVSSYQNNSYSNSSTGNTNSTGGAGTGGLTVIGFDGKVRGGDSTNSSSRSSGGSSGGTTYINADYDPLKHAQATEIWQNNWAKSGTQKMISDVHIHGVNISSLATDVETVTKENYDSVNAQLESNIATCKNNLLECEKEENYNNQQRHMLGNEIRATKDLYGTAMQESDAAYLKFAGKSNILRETIPLRDQADTELSAINAEYGKLCEDVRAKEEIKTEKEVNLSAKKDDVGRAEGKLQGLQAKQEAAQKILDGINKEENPEEYNNALNKLNELNTNIQKAEQELESAKKEEENAKTEFEKAKEELANANQAKEEKLNSLKEKELEHKELIERCISMQKEVETCQTNYDIAKEQADNLRAQQYEIKTNLDIIDNIDTKRKIIGAQEQLRDLNRLKVRLAEKRDGFDT